MGAWARKCCSPQLAGEDCSWRMNRVHGKKEIRSRPVKRPADRSMFYLKTSVAGLEVVENGRRRQNRTLQRRLIGMGLWYAASTDDLRAIDDGDHGHGHADAQQRTTYHAPTEPAAIDTIGAPNRSNHKSHRRCAETRGGRSVFTSRRPDADGPASGGR